MGMVRFCIFYVGCERLIRFILTVKYLSCEDIPVSYGCFLLYKENCISVMNLYKT